jgi:N-acetylmuramoyl-L-alanine amidase
MLKKTEVPTIIVECGFLSNLREAEKLVTDEYQEQMAEAICDGILTWLSQN